MTRTDTASILLSAAPSRVYAALIDPDALSEWLPPEGMTGRFEHFDPTVGGTYRLVLSFTDPRTTHGKTTANSDVVEVRFLQLVPDQRIVQAVDFVSEDPANAGTMTMTWELAEQPGGGTRVTIRADDVPDGISADDHASGLASSLANLASHLER